MRKICVFILLFIGILSSGVGQNVNVIVYGNNGDYYINGISSSLDIGGVETSFHGNSHSQWCIALENYNHTTVTVLCVIGYTKYKWDGETYNKESKEKTINCVLQANEKKDIAFDCWKAKNYRYTENCEDFNIKGLIVRKLAQ